MVLKLLIFVVSPCGGNLDFLDFLQLTFYNIDHTTKDKSIEKKIPKDPKISFTDPRFTDFFNLQPTI